ncbi:hypothetical protein NADFUDRAFT_45469 [Nadsonia fulvescens var. elongata DSM 6958]|uniref:Large ribosomal subunit protein bL32m n=1 Tax=Nadsonia fulvescens var. elongata DSM 6958 TaxID=857566 RepID=A0A1E3PPI3_9ASCO|nr:hypothetical protein NADFUDRAFT_45469 [Nadsonia fulvescens var. elongata DSM 6958]
MASVASWSRSGGSSFLNALGSIIRPGMPSFTLRLPTFLPGPSASEVTGTGIDAGLVLAVPKKKVSHMKKRQKRYAPGDKQLKQLTNLNRCPSCGHYKRAHTLCMHCVGEIKALWRTKEKNETRTPGVATKPEDFDDIDRQIMFPGKIKSAYEKKMENINEWLYKRPRTLPVEKKVGKK